MVQVVIHTNFGLDNQRECAGWLQEGFSKHGITADVTPDKYKDADIHVIQGPHYCYHHWLENCAGNRVLWLNRTLWGHPRLCVSLGWLRPDGGRDFRNRSVADGKGVLPPIKARKEERRRAVVFASYGEQIDLEPIKAKYAEVGYRPHPQANAPDLDIPIMAKPQWGLDRVFSWADVAVGHSSTVLVDARINGLHIDCSDPLNPVCDDPDDDDLWIKRLSWANWNYRELMNGDFWEHLR